MTPASNGIVIVDANVLIAICANEPKQATAEKVLEAYANDNWDFYAPNIIVAEVLYLLCQKHQDGTLTESDYEKALENFQDQMLAIKTISDAVLIKRAIEIHKGYGCSRSADSLYISLAEYLSTSNTVEIVTFDSGIENQVAKNAPNIKTKILPA